MFTNPCLLRNANKDLWIKLVYLGYDPEYMTFKYNLEGLNLVCENQQWHYTDSDNKPWCIDCGENEKLFLAIASLQDDSDSDQWFVYPETDTWFLCDYHDIEAERNAPSTRNSCQSAWFYNSHKATVEELINHFS